MTDTATFFGNTLSIISKQMSAWSIDGTIDDDNDCGPGGTFYEDAASQVSTALIQGGFSTTFSSTDAPIAYKYVASIHRKLTVLLYIESRRISSMGESDPSRGAWGDIRRRLSSIAAGEPFGELSAPRGSVQAGTFLSDDPFFAGMSCNRML